MRLDLLTAIVGLFVVSACGSKAATTTTVTTVEPTSSVTVARSTTTVPPAVTTTTAGSSSSSSVPAGSGGSSSAFCDAARRQVTDLPKKFQVLVTGGGDTAGWLAYADEAQKNNDEIKRLVPAEIKDAYAILAQPSDGIVTAIRDAGGDIAAIRPNLIKITATARTPEFKTASAASATYLKTVCGLDVAAVLTN